MEVKTVKDLLELTKYNYTSIGCYTLVAYTKGGDTFHPKCAHTLTEARKVKRKDTDRVVYVEIYDEGDDLECCECGGVIKPSYDCPLD
jgi:hypothetical protein